MTITLRGSKWDDYDTLFPTRIGDYHEQITVQIARTITKMKANRRHRTLHQATTWNHRLVSASQLSASRLERGSDTRSLSCCNVLVVITIIKITRIIVARAIMTIKLRMIAGIAAEPSRAVTLENEDAE